MCIAYVYVCMYVCKCGCKCGCMHICIAYVYVCMYKCVYVYVEEKLVVRRRKKRIKNSDGMRNAQMRYTFSIHAGVWSVLKGVDFCLRVGVHLDRCVAMMLTLQHVTSLSYISYI